MEKDIVCGKQKQYNKQCDMHVDKMSCYKSTFQVPVSFASLHLMAVNALN